MFPHTQKHTLGRVINLDVAQKCSIFIGSVVTSTPPSQCASCGGTYRPVGFCGRGSRFWKGTQGRGAEFRGCRKHKQPFSAQGLTATTKRHGHSRRAAGP